MSLDIGTLVGFVELDTSAAEKGANGLGGVLASAGRVWSSVLDKATGRWSQTFAAAGADSGDAFTDNLADGIDTTKAEQEVEGGNWSTVAAGVGLAAAGAFSASLWSAMDAEPAQDKLAAQLGLSAGEAKRIGKLSGELYANAYGASLSEVNDAVGAVYRNIDGMATASTDELSSVTAGVMDVAAAFDQDMSMAVAAVGTMMRTGMAKDAQEALDIITVGLQGPANKADDLLETFNEYSTQFRKVGLDGKTALGMLQQGLQGGARDADIVADAIKEFSIRSMEALEKTDSKGRAQLTELGQAFITLGMDGYKAQADLAAGGPKAQKALDMVLDRLRNVKDPATRAMTAVALFGTQAEDLGDALYSLDASKAAGELGKVEGATAKMGKTLADNAATNIESFKRKAKAAFVDTLGGRVLPFVTDLTSALVTGLGPAVSAVTGFFRDHKGVAIGLVSVIGALAAITAAHALVLGISTGSLMAWFTATKVVTAATRVWAAVQWALNASFWASPIGLVVLAIAGLVAAVVLAYSKVGWFRDAVNAAFRGIKAAAVAVGTFFTTKVPKFFSDAWTKVTAVTKTLLSAYVAYVTFLPRKIIGGLSSLAGKVGGLFRGAWNGAISITRNLGGQIVGFIAGIPGRIAGLGAKFGTAGRNLLQRFIDGMKNAAGIISGIAGNVWSAVRGLLNGAITKINNALEFTIDLPGPKNLNVNLPNIPHLATGGRVTRDTIARIGEKEPETVLRDRDIVKLLTKARTAGQSDMAGAGRSAPLIGQVVQQPGEDPSVFAERVWFRTLPG